MAKSNAINTSEVSTVLLTDASGSIQTSATMTDGQVIIGDTGGTPVAATLTAGSGISITNGAGAITVASTGSLINVQYLTASSGTYTKTAGTNKILVMAVGGGGGGGGVSSFSGSNTLAIAAGGGAGAFCQKFYSTAPSTASYSVGTAGAGGAAGLNNGSSGGDTTFNGDFTAGGGSGGAAGAQQTVTTSTNVINAQTSGGVASGSYDIGTSGGASAYAFAMDGLAAISGTGGRSFFGPGGGGRETNAAGIDAGGYGGGGGGAKTVNSSGGPFAGGDGAAGIIIVYEYS